MKTLFRIISVFVCLSTAIGCRCNTSAGTGGHMPIAQSGALIWHVDGKEIRVANTYFLALREGLQFTIEYKVPSDVDVSSITDQQAYDVAFPLMKYAFEHRLYERTKVTTVGSSAVPVSRMGVSLFVRVDKGTRGYHVARNLREIQTRISSNR